MLERNRLDTFYNKLQAPFRTRITADLSKSGKKKETRNHWYESAMERTTSARAGFEARSRAEARRATLGRTWPFLSALMPDWKDAWRPTPIPA